MKALKRICYGAIFAIAAFGTMAGAVELGIPFGFQGGQAVGVRIHFTELYALQALTIFNADANQTDFTLSADNLFYITQTEDLRQYLGVNLNINLDGDFGTGAFYGLQHSVTNVIDVYGQVGFGLSFDPTFLTTFSTGVGVVFYVLR